MYTLFHTVCLYGVRTCWNQTKANRYAILQAIYQKYEWNWLISVIKEKANIPQYNYLSETILSTLERSSHYRVDLVNMAVIPWKQNTKIFFS